MLKNKTIYTVIAIILCVLCVGGTASTLFAKPEEGTYSENLELARDCAEKELFYKSVYYYDIALSEKGEEKIMLEELDAVKGGVETGEFYDDDYENYLSKYLKTYYKSEAPYNIALDYYYNQKKYDKCLEIISDAAAYGVSNKTIKQCRNNISRKYTLVNTNYTSVTPFRSYLASVNLDQKYGLVDSYGTVYADCQYKNYSPCFYITENEGESRLWSFAKDEKRCYLLNLNQVRQAYLPAEIESSTGIGDELLSCKIGDKYVYYDINGKKKFDKEYAYASKFITNIAAVYDGNVWSVINTNGDVLGSNFYDVKLNGFDECVSNRYLYIKESATGKYTAYKYENGKITKTDKSFDDVDLSPSSGEYIAYKENDKWGYIDTQLNVVLKPQYEMAHSFSSGYAGVQKDGKWTLVNTDFKDVIDVEDEITDISYTSAYEDGDGNSHAYVFVQIYGAWQLMGLYIL